MRIVNIILGLGTAIILGALINLGIRAFYPEPVSPYDVGVYPKALPPYQEFNCDKADAKCIADRNARYAEQQKQQEEMQQKDRAYQNAMKLYNRNVFIIANVVGIIIFIAGFWLIFATAVATQSVPIGVMIAGLWSIIYGYARGWGSIDDRLKFFVGLAVAALVIGGSVWLIQRYQKRRLTP